MSTETPTTTDSQRTIPDSTYRTDDVAVERRFDAEHSQEIVLADHLDAPVSGTVFIDEDVLGEEWDAVLQALAQTLSDVTRDLEDYEGGEE